MTNPRDAGPTPPEPQERGIELSVDERAAARAFVARCEVRLSTVHRIAVGMLSGAGLLVVLPVVARDSVTGVIGDLTAPVVDGELGAVPATLHQDQIAAHRTGPRNGAMSGAMRCVHVALTFGQQHFDGQSQQYRGPE